MSRIAIVNGIRTPFAKMGTVFNDLGAVELGRIAMRELLTRTPIDPKIIDEVILGCVGQPADAANIARVVALYAGVPIQTPAITVHRNCASGIESVAQACSKIKANEGSVFMVGGTESMSNIPFYFSKATQEIFTALSRAKTPMARIATLMRFRLHHFSPRIGLQLGLTDPVCGLNMGQTAEVLAKEFGISRRDQDMFSLISHQRAVVAKPYLREEIVPVIPSPKFKEAILDDNGPREGQTIEALAKLKPFFERGTGTVTAGNASQVTDGACALLVMTEDRARELGLNPLGYIRSIAFAGVEPQRMGIGPAHAIPLALRKAGMKFSDIQAFEINEAFAAQVIACTKALASSTFTQKYSYEGLTGEINPDRLNMNGGAIALGHPVGTTGARLILTMLKNMQRKQFATGLVSLCVGGGQGAAVILER